jgi:hypothetical protein
MVVYSWVIASFVLLTVDVVLHCIMVRRIDLAVGIDKDSRMESVKASDV